MAEKDVQYLHDLIDPMTTEQFQNLLEIGNQKLPDMLVETYLLVNSQCCRGGFASRLEGKDLVMIALIAGVLDFPSFMKRRIDKAKDDYERRLDDYRKAALGLDNEPAPEPEPARTQYVQNVGKVQIGTVLKTDYPRGITSGTFIGVDERGRIGIQNENGNQRWCLPSHITGVGDG